MTAATDFSRDLADRIAERLGPGWRPAPCPPADLGALACYRFVAPDDRVSRIFLEHGRFGIVPAAGPADASSGVFRHLDLRVDPLEPERAAERIADWIRGSGTTPSL